MRVFLQYILPILAPLAVYITWMVLRGKHKELPSWSEGPWFWLIVVGFVLGATSLIYFGFSGLHDTGGEYIPPRYEDGRIVPPQHK